MSVIADTANTPHQNHHTTDMETSVIISPRVIDTINSLSADDRGPISSALSMEFILGKNPEEILAPMQMIIYAVIRFYVTQDSERFFRTPKVS